MAPLSVLNRGFGGAKINDVIYFADKIVLPYRPKIIVFYAGDNDMSTGTPHSPERVLENTRRFTELVHSSLPETVIYFISIKPSKSRWNYWPSMKEANRMIASFAKKRKNLEFIDISAAMLDEKGDPRGDILLFDNLHMNSEGYAIWTRIIRPVIEKKFLQKKAK